MKFDLVPCQICGKEIKLRKGAIMFGIICGECNKNKTVYTHKEEEL